MNVPFWVAVFSATVLLVTIMRCPVEPCKPGELYCSYYDEVQRESECEKTASNNNQSEEVVGDYEVPQIPAENEESHGPIKTEKENKKNDLPVRIDEAGGRGVEETEDRSERAVEFDEEIDQSINQREVEVVDEEGEKSDGGEEIEESESLKAINEENTEEECLKELIEIGGEVAVRHEETEILRALAEDSQLARDSAEVEEGMSDIHDNIQESQAPENECLEIANEEELTGGAVPGIQSKEIETEKNIEIEKDKAEATREPENESKEEEIVGEAESVHMMKHQILDFDSLDIRSHAVDEIVPTGDNDYFKNFDSLEDLSSNRDEGNEDHIHGQQEECESDSNERNFEDGLKEVENVGVNVVSAEPKEDALLREVDQRKVIEEYSKYLNDDSITVEQLPKDTTLGSQEEDTKLSKNRDVSAGLDTKDEESKPIEHCFWKGPIPGTFSRKVKITKARGELADILDDCEKIDRCAAVSSLGQRRYELFSSAGDLKPTSHGEMSFIKTCRKIEVKEIEDESWDKELQPIENRWALQIGKQPMDVGYTADGEQSIFVSVASYRDSLCRDTINDAFRRAKHPQRIFVGVVEQNLPYDEPCLPVSKEECVDEREPLCKYFDQIRVYKMHARLARGPTLARHMAEHLYRGETFTLQIDSHMLFVREWDTGMISQFNSLGDEFAVLTTYPTSATGSINMFYGDSRVKTVPIMCKAGIMSNGIIRFGSAVEAHDSQIEGNLAQPYWAAGLSFSRGHRILQVPYDCCTPQLFMGEEIAMAARMFTHGYNFYAFQRSLVFHFYPEERPHRSIPSFFENSDLSPELEKVLHHSTNRVRVLLGYSLPEGESLLTPIAPEYNIGKNRSLESYFDLLGVSFNDERTEILHIHPDLCDTVLQGAINFNKIEPEERIENERSFETERNEDLELADGSETMHTELSSENKRELDHQNSDTERQSDQLEYDKGGPEVGTYEVDTVQFLEHIYYSEETPDQVQKKDGLPLSKEDGLEIHIDVENQRGQTGDETSKLLKKDPDAGTSFPNPRNNLDDDKIDPSIGTVVFDDQDESENYDIELDI